MDERGARGSREWREVRPGLWLMTAIAAFCLIVFFLDRALRAMEEGPRVVVATGAAPGLEAGTTVWIAGRPAGRVVSVRFRREASGRGSIVAEAVLHHDAGGVLREDAEALVTRAGMLAPTVLSLSAGSPGRPPLSLEDTIFGSATILDQDLVLARIDTLGATLESARPLATRLAGLLTGGEGTLGALLANPEPLASVRRRWREMERRAGPDRPAGGLLAGLGSDTSLATAFERIDGSLRRLSERRAGENAPERALADLIAAIEGLGLRLAAIEEAAARSRGTVGRTLHDEALSIEAARMRAGLDSLRAELFREPLRWLRLRLF